jgi:hypothetical protein
MNCITVQENEKPLNPCQLHKISGSACSMICAFLHDCPVFNIDEHDSPILTRHKPEDLEV